MNRQQAIKGHKARLRRLTEEQAINLMEHAANKTPLLPCDQFRITYVSDNGEC